MNWLDRLLQNRRIEQAIPWIQNGAHVLDVGCADGALFRQAGDVVASGVGLDLERPHSWWGERFEFRLAGTQREPYWRAVRYGRHARGYRASNEEVQQLWAGAMPHLLRPGGRLIITAPSPTVDPIIDVARRLRLLHGMETEQHHGFDPADVPRLYSAPNIVLERWSRFQLGLNNLFVFGRTAERSC